jgi:hypothetical protein
MEMYCAACGCLVERGVRVVPCNSAECCCLDLPIHVRTVDQIADQLRSAFATQDLNALGRLLAGNARWGSDDNPDQCRSRGDVVATFDRLLGEGVEAEITDTIVGPNGLAVLLQIEWPNPGEGREASFYQTYRVASGAVTEIQHHDDRKSAVAAISK